MTILIVVALALICATVTQGELCRFNEPVTTSHLKCEDKIYHKPAEMIAAFNECAAGKNGTEVNFAYVVCFFEKNGFIHNGVIDSVALGAAFKRDFGEHYEPIFRGIWDCQVANPTESNLKNPLKLVACMDQAYQDVCKHRTCDFINTLD